MATNIQRAQAICDAIMNTAVSSDQLIRLGAAFAQQAGRMGEWNAATNDQKAAFLVSQVRLFCVNSVIAAESSVAASTASQSAATKASTDYAGGA